MIVGIISFKKNHYHLQLDDNKLSIIETDNNDIRCLSHEEAINLFEMLFNNTSLTYIYDENDFKVYLDRNNYKRYFKNDQEDFTMFFSKNGMDATAYSKIKGLNISKKFLFTIAGYTVALIFTLPGLNVFSTINDLDRLNIQYAQIKTDYYEDITLDKIKEYIDCSEFISSEEKETIYNEEYLSFALDYYNTDMITFTLNDRFKNIEVQSYPEEVYPGFAGFYCYDNKLHILNTISPDEDYYYEVLAHEFIHLTQATTYYNYFTEAIDSIINVEFFDAQSIAYPNLTVRTKELMEIIGVEPLLKFNYTGDITPIKEEMSKYLTMEECDNFFNIIATYDYENDEEIHEKIDPILEKLYYNKYHYGMNYNSYINEIKTNPYTINNRIYFNKNKKEYYEPYKLYNFIMQYLPPATFGEILGNNKIQTIKKLSGYISYKDYEYYKNTEEGKSFFSHIFSSYLYNEDKNDEDKYYHIDLTDVSFDELYNSGIIKKLYNVYDFQIILDNGAEVKLNKYDYKNIFLTTEDINYDYKINWNTSICYYYLPPLDSQQCSSVPNYGILNEPYPTDLNIEETSKTK